MPHTDFLSLLCRHNTAQDDGGETWQVSETVVPECNEAQMVELPNGTILLNARDEVSKPSGGRRIAMSTDAGKTWIWREK